ncbi:receptor expression-enhancing protein 1-like isoform 3-T3 [Vipera latastei]
MEERRRQGDSQEKLRPIQQPPRSKQRKPDRGLLAAPPRLAGRGGGGDKGGQWQRARAVGAAMVAWALSRAVQLLLGTLYPAYASYKAVRNKDVREYVRWMMYWIVFALFMATETVTDTFFSWFPFYYEIKMAFVVWLLSPYTKGASLLYRKLVHPTLSSKEKEIDHFICQAKERGYESLVSFGKKSINVAATAAIQVAAKGQGALAGRLRSFSMQDLRSIPETAMVHYSDPLYLEEQELCRQPVGGIISPGVWYTTWGLSFLQPRLISEGSFETELSSLKGGVANSAPSALLLIKNPT